MAINSRDASTEQTPELCCGSPCMKQLPKETPQTTHMPSSGQSKV